jgi:hypothetical protein
MSEISEFVTKEELFDKLKPTFFKTSGIRQAISLNNEIILTPPP